MGLPLSYFNFVHLPRPAPKKGRKRGSSESGSDLDFGDADIGPARDRPGKTHIKRTYGFLKKEGTAAALL